MFNSKKFYFILIGVVIVLSVISFIVTFISINFITENNIREFQNNIISQKKSELQDRVNIVYNIVQTDYKASLLKYRKAKAKKIAKTRIKVLFSILNAYYQHHKNDKNLQNDIKLIVKNATFNPKKFYFWINDLTLKVIMHPIIEALNNKRLYSFKDVNGKYLFREIVEIAKSKGEGFVNYYWLDPKNKKMEEKISYIKLFRPLKWVIGTGVYLCNNTKIIKEKTLQEIKNATFGKNGYFWVNNMNYQMIMHPIKPQYNGKIFKNTPKVPFVELGVDALKKSNKNYAFISYIFYNPASKRYEKKLSIVKLFKPWNWVIGTGVYLRDVESTVIKMREKSNQEIEKIIEILIIVNLIVIFLILLISKTFMNRYEELATKDKLTNIYNRLKIDNFLKEQILISQRYNKDLSIIFFDIDHFKRINDTYGHKMGDYVLQEIASLVKEHIRNSDFFGRWGGEEFLVILPETKLNEAFNIAEKLRNIIQHHKFKKVGKITCSFGVVDYQEDNDINSLLERVDKLLYEAKETGRNRVKK